MGLQDFKKQSLLYEDTTRIIYRAYSTQDRKSVIIKTFKKDHLSLQENAILENEFNICQSLSFPGLLTPLHLTRDNSGILQIWKDFKGITLKEWISKNPRPKLETFLKIAINIIDCLASMHSKEYAHCNLNSHNVLVNPKNYSTKLMNLEQAVPISRNEADVQGKTNFKAILEYMAPEQTGRMNKDVNYQTDFYSLGIVFYELLTGVLPFQSTTTLDLIYSHIAKTPPSPNEHRQHVPEVVSEIISKCLAKNAEDRYKDAYGLKRDL